MVRRRSARKPFSKISGKASLAFFLFNCFLYFVTKRAQKRKDFHLLLRAFDRRPACICLSPCSLKTISEVYCQERVSFI